MIKNIQKSRMFSLVLLFCGVFVLFLPMFVFAEGLIQPCGSGENNIPGISPGDCRNVEILLLQAIKIAEFLFTIIGTLAFAMFVYGGLKMILSFGVEEKYKEGMKAMLNAVIGMFIAFSAYILVNFALDVLGVQGQFKGVGNSGPTAPAGGLVTNPLEFSNCECKVNGVATFQPAETQEICNNLPMAECKWNIPATPSTP